MNSGLADRIATLGGGFVEVKLLFRDGHGIKGAYRESDAWGSQITVELHFNASDNAHATGTGVLYYPGSTKGRRWAGLLRDRIGEALGLPDWPSDTGSVVTPRQASGVQERGRMSLGAGRAPAALIEPFFGSHPDDCTVAAGRQDALPRAVIAAAIDF